jgi:outer membrane receptor protein involved in Fe transport
MYFTFNIGTPFNSTAVASNPSALANGSLLPERQESYEFGLEMSFKETP